MCARETEHEAVWNSLQHKTFTFINSTDAFIKIDFKPSIDKTGTQVRKQTDWLNRPSASRLTSQKSVNYQHIETLSPRYHTIETVSVPRIRKYKKTFKPIYE